MDLETPFPRGVWRFQPPCCPYADCPSRTGRDKPFLWQRRGRYTRRCDGRSVQRFLCRVCHLTFSVQTFRVDYRLRRPELTPGLFDSFVSIGSQRQTARNLRCTRKTVRRRLILLSGHARSFHDAVLERQRQRGGWSGHFQLDELETFEWSRRLAPVTMPILIDKESAFIVHFAAAALPARGRLKQADLKRKLAREQKFGVRLSGSRAAVLECFTRLTHVADKNPVTISTDKKTSYPTVLREVMRGPYSHWRHSSTAPRTPQNPLFAINHTLAMLRAGMSRLVQRSWAVSKERRWLALHGWIWVAYRNYIRYITNKRREETSAQVRGVVARGFSKMQFFEWRVISAA